MEVYQTAFKVSEYTDSVNNVVFHFTPLDDSGCGYVSKVYFKHTGYGNLKNTFFESELCGMGKFIRSREMLLNLIDKLNEDY